MADIFHVMYSKYKHCLSQYFLDHFSAMYFTIINGLLQGTVKKKAS